MDASTGGAEEARRGEGRGRHWKRCTVAQGGSSKAAWRETKGAGGGDVEPLRAMRQDTCGYLNLDRFLINKYWQ